MNNLEAFLPHNLFTQNFELFEENDPHLRVFNQQKYQYNPRWWLNMPLDSPGIYILTGGRQVGKSTSCKLLIKHCLMRKLFLAENIFYLTCDEIFDAKELSYILRPYLENKTTKFLLIIDEVTFVDHWDRVIKALADEGHFSRGLCLLTGSDTLILKEAAMRFPGRRGHASPVDFHLYPLSFREYVQLLEQSTPDPETIAHYFHDYLRCGGYLRAINDIAQYPDVTPSTFLTYEQWIRGDFLKQGKHEDYLLALLKELLMLGVSPISFSAMTQKIGSMSKETCMDYLKLLQRMDILINLQAFDQNKKQGFPKKDRKFHFFDPFIHRTISQWLQREGYINTPVSESTLVEACVASHCVRLGKSFYFKAQGEIDLIWLQGNTYRAIEVKWTNQLRPNDLKMLKQFKNSLILGKASSGTIDTIQNMPVFQFLYELNPV